MPPFSRVERNPFDAFPKTVLQLGGLAYGVIAPNDLWFEGGISLIRGLSGLGWETTALAGYAIGYDRAPETWNFSLPVYLGYRFAQRPSMRPSDGSNATQDTHMLVVGTRTVWSRFFRRAPLELGLDFSLSIPFARGVSSTNMWRDPATSVWVSAALVVGW